MTFGLWLNFPGYAYSDTFMQYEYALKLLTGEGPVITDHHPIVMTILLALFQKIFGNGIGGLLIFHQLLFWTGLLLIARRLLPGRTGLRALGVLAIGFFPPVFGVLGGVLKDLAFTSSLVCLASLALWLPEIRALPTGKRRAVWGLLGFCIAYASLVRFNGFPAVLPWIALIAGQWGSTRATRRRALFALLGAVLVIGVAHRVLTYNVFRAHRGFLIQQLFAHDLTGMSLQIGQNLIPDAFAWKPPVTLELLEKRYTPKSCMYLFALGPVEELLRESQDAATVNRLRRLWLTSIFAHPAAYLAHRWEVTKRYFHVPGEEVCWPIMSELPENRWGFSTRKTRLHEAIYGWLAEVSQGPLFRGFVYLLLNAGILVAGALGWRRRRDPRLAYAVVFAVSGLLYVLPSIFVTLGCDFRYQHWAIVAALSGLMALGSGFMVVRPKRSAV